MDKRELLFTVAAGYANDLTVEELTDKILELIDPKKEIIIVQ